MPELSERLPQNVTGPFYVDSTCIDCDQCRSFAPEFYRRDDETGFSFVYRQPTTIDEIERARDAMDGCPTESIGCDGAE